MISGALVILFFVFGVASRRDRFDRVAAILNTFARVDLAARHRRL